MESLLFTLTLRQKFQCIALIIFAISGVLSSWWFHLEWLFLPIIMAMGIVALNKWHAEYIVKILFPVFIGGFILNPFLGQWGLFFILIVPLIYVCILRNYWKWVSPAISFIFLVCFSVVMLSGLSYSNTVDNCVFDVSRDEKGVSIESIHFCESLNLYQPALHTGKEGFTRGPGIMARTIFWLFYISSLVLYGFTFWRGGNNKNIFEEMDEELEKMSSVNFSKRKI